MKKNLESKIGIVRGNITKLDVDAIVNAANTTLLGGGGVDGAIHRAAGPELLAECRTLGGCQPGEAKLTRGYRLPARFVIHTVGPIWTGGKRGEAQILANCYRNSLHLAVENGIKTVAFPAISCGAYRYPIREAAQIALETTREFLAKTDKIDKVIFVVANDEILRAYGQLL
jgi:O-acetyl-ADP-ribose deacetylase